MSDRGQECEALREWELRVCPDCGNHLTAFSLCEHQKGGDGPTGIDFDKFTFVRVLEAEPVERELERLRGALAAREGRVDRDPSGFDDMVIAMEDAAHQLCDASEDQSSHFYETILRAALAARAQGDVSLVDAAYVRSALAMLVQSELTGSSYYAICRKLEDGLAAREDTERPESEQERLAHLRCRCGTAIAVDCPEHGGGI